MQGDSQLAARVRALRQEHDAKLRQYQEVTRRVRAYGRRPELSPGQRLEWFALQRMRLVRKHALAEVTAALSDLERSMDGPSSPVETSALSR